MEPVVDIHAHFLPQAAVRAHEAGRSWHGTTVERSPRGTPVLRTGDDQVGLGAVEVPSPATDALCAAAREAGSCVVMGLCQRSPHSYGRRR